MLEEPKHENMVEDTLNELIILIDAHAKKEENCSLIYYMLGSLTVILSTVATSIAGSKGFDTGDVLDIVTFCFTLIVALLSVLLNFFKIEQKIQLHHAASFDYRNLFNDMQLQIVNSKLDSEELSDDLKRKRLITKHAPLLTNKCCL